MTIAARIVVNDFQRGRLPFFEPPPFGSKDAPRTTVDPEVGCVNTMHAVERAEDSDSAVVGVDEDSNEDELEREADGNQGEEEDDGNDDDENGIDCNEPGDKKQDDSREND